MHSTKLISRVLLRPLRRLLLISCVALSPVASPGQTLPALEETNKTSNIRPYVHMRSGEFDTVWGVQDMWGFGVGADISRHVGLELVFDSYEKDFDPFGTKIGEQSLLSLVPQVRLRLPLADDKIVPYVIAGAGIGWYAFNDPTSAGFNREVDAQGTKLVISAGVGVDFFINRNVAFNLEGKYMWLDDLSVTVTNPDEQGTYKLADFVGTFGFRAYLDDDGALPLVDAMDEPPVRIYFGAAFGAGLITDGDWAPGVSLKPESASIGTAGESVEIALGVNFGRNLGIELPIDYYESVIVLDGRGGVTGGVGEYSTYAFIPSLRFRWPIKNGKVVPYVMGGFGGTYSEVNDRYYKPIPITVDSKGFAPAYSVGGGVEYHFNPDVSLFGQVKYIYSWDNKIEIGDGMGEQKGDLSWLHFQIGFRLNLLKLGGGEQ